MVSGQWLANTQPKAVAVKESRQPISQKNGPLAGLLTVKGDEDLMIITDTRSHDPHKCWEYLSNWSFNTGCESHETGSGCENCDLYNSPTRRKDEEVVEENE